MPLFELCNKFIADMTMLRWLLKQFQLEDSVEAIARRSNLSRSAIYERVKALGLTADHFRYPEATPELLLEAGGSLRTLREQIISGAPGVPG